MSRYLVTGGAGFLGSALVRRLLQEGHQVRVVDNQSRGSARRLAEVRDRIEFIEGDVRDFDTVRRAARGASGVCHLAFVNGTEFFYSKPDVVLEVGVKGIVHVLEACRAESVPELLLVSSSEVYQAPPAIPTTEEVPLSIPDPLNPRYSYAAGKIISEMMALHMGGRFLRRVVIVRPHNVFGPDMGWEHVIPQLAVRIQRLARESAADPLSVPIQGTGQETRAFVFIEDFIRGVMQVLERGDHLGIYHVGTMEEQTIAALAGEIGALVGRRIRVVPGPPAAGSVARRCPDIRKLAALGFQPAWTFRAALAETVRWYEAHDAEQPTAAEARR